MNTILGTVMCMLFVAITAINDGKKEKEPMKMEAEKMEMEAKKKKEMEKKKMEEERKAIAMKNSIAGKAMATEDLFTLVAALIVANLVNMLSEPFDYMVFNQQIMPLKNQPVGTVYCLLNLENKDTPQKLLN